MIIYEIGATKSNSFKHKYINFYSIKTYYYRIHLIGNMSLSGHPHLYINFKKASDYCLGSDLSRAFRKKYQRLGRCWNSWRAVRYQCGFPGQNMKVPFVRQRLSSYLMWSIQTTDLKNNSNFRLRGFRRDCPVTK